jgi:hypothetical protein
VEWLFSGSPTLTGFYRDALPRPIDGSTRQWLLTDDPAVVQIMPAGLFDEVITIEQGKARSARDLEGTHTAAFFSQVAGQLALWQKDAAENQAKGLLWVHFSGMSGPWDAPIAWRHRFLDEDELPAPKFVSAPVDMRGVTDPDELLGYRAAYAAQISAIEACMTAFVEAFEELPADAEKLAMVTGSRGFSLGEHGFVGQDPRALYGEQLHLPLLGLMPESHGPLPRVTGFAQPADIGVTVSHWLAGRLGDSAAGVSLAPYLSGESGRIRDVVVASTDAGYRMIRTPAWMMIEGNHTELYAKPDDRWEANDVASLCPEIVEKLCQHLETTIAGNPEALSEELLSPWR